MSKGIAFIRLITGNGRQRLSGSSDKAAVFAVDGSVLETTMNDIELHIASKYLNASLKYMGA